MREMEKDRGKGEKIGSKKAEVHEGSRARDSRLWTMEEFDCNLPRRVTQSRVVTRLAGQLFQGPGEALSERHGRETGRRPSRFVKASVY